jgi:hypothetical protein
MTFFILGGAFLLGYIYARVSRDEFTRRRGYARYTNFMILFDKYSGKYEDKWERLKLYCYNFDHTYMIWRQKTLQMTEWKIKKKYEREILEK